MKTEPELILTKEDGQSDIRQTAEPNPMTGLYPLIGRLEAEGCSVAIESLYFKQKIPIWRIKVDRNGHPWISFEGDLDGILSELTKLKGLLPPPTIHRAQPRLRTPATAKIKRQAAAARGLNIFDRNLDSAFGGH